MFEETSDGALLDFMGAATREESTSVAKRLLAVGELFLRRKAEWAHLDLDSEVAELVAAEVSMAQHISHARAKGQIDAGRTLRERLPAVADLFLRGCIDWRMVSMIMARTANVGDEAIGAVDTAIALRAQKWMKLSKPKMRDRIDFCVAKYDPDGQRVPREDAENRYMEVAAGAAAGMAFINGHIHAVDAATVDARLEALAASVCVHDPRSHRQRRADAMGPLGRYEATMACLCGRDDCDAAQRKADAAALVIHVLADQATLDGDSDRPGYMPGLGVLPAESVRDLAADATVTPIEVPASGEQAADEAADLESTGYRPSAGLREWIRWRDLTCRWPGCDQPAQVCDVDHTRPWPAGPTHASNTKLYCRTHHLIKTFAGFSDFQFADGTLIVTSPHGYTAMTEPHGAALFPALGTPTGVLGLPFDEPVAERTALMPKRRQSRERQRRDRIIAERRQRRELNEEKERQRRAWLAATYEPPPF